MVSVIVWSAAMRYRHSLRFRILIAFLGSGLILGPLLAVTLLWITYELEETAIERVLTERLHQVMSAPQNFPLLPLDTAEPTLVLGSVETGLLPESTTLAPGLYEIEPPYGLQYDSVLPAIDAPLPDRSRQSWVLAVGLRDNTTYIVAENISALEYLESLTLWNISIGIAVAVYVSLWLGYYLSRHLIEPLQQLAAAVDRDSRPEVSPVVVSDYPPDEIGLLAGALDRYYRRMIETLQREQNFSTDASHELRNPLSVIRSSLEIAERDAGLKPVTRRALDRARDAAADMTETISTLLLLAQDPHRPAHHPELDVAMVLAPVIVEFQDDDTTRIDWQQTGIARVHAPETAVRAVIINLLRNAVQHAPGGRITVTLSDDRLQVQDTGVGIAHDELINIRNPGVRGSNARGPGSGIGLSLVDRLCEIFGWQIDIDSEIGTGTCVTWQFDRTTAAPTRPDFM